VHGAAFLSAKTSVCGTFRTYATADNAGAEILQPWLLPQQQVFGDAALFPLPDIRQ
jgi:hypothetical protein